MAVDLYKQLKLEYPGIKEVILSYSNEGNIHNFTNGLGQALESDQSDEILYYLKEIVTWYSENIRAINANDYVYDKASHARNKKLLEEFAAGLQDYDFPVEKQNTICVSGEKKIFLSHKSSDKIYADALEKLIVGLGVKNEQLIYTSHPLHKIPLGMKIYEYLRQNITSEVFMIILWSNEYLESPACMSEMGAAWVVQNDYIGIYSPDFQFGSPKYHECPIDTTKMGAVLNGDDNCKASMIEFKNKVIEYFDLEVDEKTSTYLIDQFMDDIKRGSRS